MNFSELGLDERLLRAVTAEGYTSPTPIQAQAIPEILKGHDLLGTAQTGTGKTAAFALPILQRLAGSTPAVTPKRKPTRVLVLTPTRELAAQIGESFATYGKHMGLTHTVIFGGVGQRAQEEALHRGIDILVATPGRLLDLKQQGYVDFSGLEVFVLDEADRMLDMGFIHDVKKIIAVIPKKRQTLFFSATMPQEIQELSKSILTNPARVSVAPVSSAAERIRQELYMVENADKRTLLTHLLQDKSIERVLVFTRTKHGANRLVDQLGRDGITAEPIHGNKSQSARERALQGFKNKTIRVLVATDIAARGIDIDELTHVLNYDLPEVPETYVHRIGRTARAGASGVAWAFCAREERGMMASIERVMRKKVDIVPTPSLQRNTNDPPPRPPLRGRNQGRGGPPRGGSSRGGPSGGAPRNGASRGGPGGGSRGPSGPSRGGPSQGQPRHNSAGPVRHGDARPLSAPPRSAPPRGPSRDR